MRVQDFRQHARGRGGRSDFEFFRFAPCFFTRRAEVEQAHANRLRRVLRLRC
jgi:hypothetical protein